MAVLDLMGFFHRLGDRNADIIKKQLPPLPCKVGCCYCCYVGPDRPDVLPPEVFRIATYLRDEGSASLAQVEARLERTNAVAKGTAGNERTATKLPCLFLAQDRCLIYPVRPMRCRAQNSPDAQACRRNYLGQRETMPLLSELALLYKSLRIGIRLALREAGLQSAPLALTGAVVIALEQPDAFDRWLNGEPVFEEVVLPHEADEERFLAQLARQAKHRVKTERRRLGKVTAIFLESPGTWALYSTHSVEPRQASTQRRTL